MSPCLLQHTMGGQTVSAFLKSSYTTLIPLQDQNTTGMLRSIVVLLLCCLHSDTSY
jgi:hypothetical protein